LSLTLTLTYPYEPPRTQVPFPGPEALDTPPNHGMKPRPSAVLIVARPQLPWFEVRIKKRDLGTKGSSRGSTGEGGRYEVAEIRLPTLENHGCD
jgi:hypothetical protein